MSSDVQHAAGEHHGPPMWMYYFVWGLLFVVSAFSYATDFLDRGALRWTLILIFMFVKAGFIMAIFMHLSYERVTLITAILVPPIALLFLIGLMATEADYTWLTRVVYMGEEANPVPLPPPTHGGGAH
jgi:caa(3)-type oxidase subunit IV